MFHKKAGALILQAEPPARDTKSLTRTPAADNVYRRQLRAVEQTDIPDMLHAGKVVRSDGDGERFDLARPQRRDPAPLAGKHKAADSVKQRPHCEHSGHRPYSVFMIAYPLQIVYNNRCGEVRV